MRVGGVQPLVTARHILRIRYVEQVLQLRDARVVGARHDEHADRVLLVDVEIAHQEVGEVVVRPLYRLSVRRPHLAVEGRVLVVEIEHQRVALLAVTETRAHAVGGVVAGVGVRELRIERSVGVGVVVAEVPCLLVALLTRVTHAVLEIELRELRQRLGVIHGALDAGVVRIGLVGEVTQQRRVGAVAVVDGRLVRITLRVVIVVAVTESHVGREQTTRLAQFEAVLQELRYVVSSLVGLVAVHYDVVDGVAVLQTVGRAERIVRLETESRARHDRLVLRYAPVETGVEAVVVVQIVGITRLLQRAQILERSLVPLYGLREILGAGAVEEVAGLQFHLVVLAPRSRVVESERSDLGHSALRTHHVLAHAATHAAAHAACRARHAEDILEREVLLVDVVEQRDTRQTVILVEIVDVAAENVFVRFGDVVGVGLIAVSRIDLAENALTHGLVRHDIDGFVALAVVHAREFGGVAQLVVDLDAVDRLRGQRLDGRRHVLAEELLAVDEDLLDLLALGLDGSVGDRDAGHLLQEALDVGVVGHLERSGVVAHRIALLRGAQRLGLLDDRLDLHARLKLQLAEVLPCGRDLERGVVVVVTQERHHERIFAVGERRKRHGTLVARRGVLFLVRIVRRGEGQHGSGDAFARVGVENGGRHGAPLRARCDGDERKQGSQ